MVAIAQESFKMRNGLFLLSYPKQTIDEPKRTNGKGRGWQSKIILIFVAIQ
jgi:hypothetical protein